MEFVGYHGTDTAGCSKILKQKRFIHSTSENEWLGDGAYFFENDKHQAYMFSKFKNQKIHVKKHGEIHVLQVLIRCKKDNCLDLVTDAGRQCVEIFKEKIRDTYGWQLKDAQVLNMLYVDQPYDMVRAVFPIPGHEDQNGEERKHSWYEGIQIQLCVRNDKCIDKGSIKEVSCDDFAG